MLARYTMHRGKPPDVIGIRQDTRKHTRHCLRPTPEMVTRLLANDPTYPWDRFREAYQKLIVMRFREDSQPFEVLAELARHESVFLGCSCPTKKNPDVYHCHTVLALQFMHEQYPDLSVVFPKG
jgi:uncharacterized protein YeaO (DUF488 family)